MIVKVCGLRDSENIRQVVGLGVDWIGMEFRQQSERNVMMIPTHAGIIPDRAPKSAVAADGGQRRQVRRVGVFTDEMAQNIITRAVNFRLNAIQLQGDEQPTIIRNLRRTLDPDLCPGVRFIKRICLTSADDLQRCEHYADCVDYFLFEAGDSAHWAWLDGYRGSIPFLLGGIGPGDASALSAFNHPQWVGIDLDLPFESAPGVKDVETLAAFLQQLA